MRTRGVLPIRSASPAPTGRRLLLAPRRWCCPWNCSPRSQAAARPISWSRVSIVSCLSVSSSYRGGRGWGRIGQQAVAGGSGGGRVCNVGGGVRHAACAAEILLTLTSRPVPAAAAAAAASQLARSIAGARVPAAARNKCGWILERIRTAHLQFGVSHACCVCCKEEGTPASSWQPIKSLDSQKACKGADIARLAKENARLKVSCAAGSGRRSERHSRISSAVAYTPLHSLKQACMKQACMKQASMKQAPRPVSTDELRRGVEYLCAPPLQLG